MGQVDVARGGAVESQCKTVGVAVVEALGADVLAPFELQHAGHAVFQQGKFIHELGVFGGRDVAVEFAQDDMAQGGGAGHGGYPSRNVQKEDSANRQSGLRAAKDAWREKWR